MRDTDNFVIALFATVLAFVNWRVVRVDPAADGFDWAFAWTWTVMAPILWADAIWFWSTK